MKTPRELTAVQRMKNQKIALIRRLTRQIEEEKNALDARQEKIRGRIRVAQAILDALDAGTLKP